MGRSCRRAETAARTFAQDARLTRTPEHRYSAHGDVIPGKIQVCGHGQVKLHRTHTYKRAPRVHFSLASGSPYCAGRAFVFITIHPYHCTKAKKKSFGQRCPALRLAMSTIKLAGPAGACARALSSPSRRLSAFWLNSKRPSSTRLGTLTLIGLAHLSSIGIVLVSRRKVACVELCPKNLLCAVISNPAD